MSTSAERVARGAAYMDEFHKGWERKVDVATLDLSGPSSTCIIAQGGDFRFVEACVYIRENGGRTGDSYEYGFLDGEGFLYSDDNEHRDLWVSLIKLRFDTGTLSDLS